MTFSTSIKTSILGFRTPIHKIPIHDIGTPIHKKLKVQFLALELLFTKFQFQIHDTGTPQNPKNQIILAMVLGILADFKVPHEIDS